MSEEIIIDVQFIEESTVIPLAFDEPLDAFPMVFMDDDAFYVEFDECSSERGTYNGKYDVVPRRWDQTLPTRSKIMTDDVLVYEIPSQAVSNIQGGLTVTIGGN